MCQIRASRLPHVTIQCPVYREDLWTVIDPTIQSVKTAIATYVRQGGSASILINDDGLRIISSADQEARIKYYKNNQVSWTARPAHMQNGYRKPISVSQC